MSQPQSRRSWSQQSRKSIDSLFKRLLKRRTMHSRTLPSIQVMSRPRFWRRWMVSWCLLKTCISSLTIGTLQKVWMLFSPRAMRVDVCTSIYIHASIWLYIRLQRRLISRPWGRIIWKCWKVRWHCSSVHLYSNSDQINSRTWSRSSD